MASEQVCFEEEWSDCWDEVMKDVNLQDLCSKEENKNDAPTPKGQPSKEQLDVLQKCFGHPSFRPIQWEVIQSVIKDRQDNCVIMATGYGKSLTYQYPAVFLQGLSIVISPLISLMKDQVLSLKMANISACFVGSAQRKQAEVLDEVFAGKVRLLYMTPEFCVNSDILQRLSRKLTINLVAIDEAHCVSQWGHDFRNDYRKLGSVRQSLPNVPFLAVTATATPVVRKDICDSLHLINPNVVCSSFDRPNLYLSVSMKSVDICTDLCKLMVRDSSRKLKFDGPTIIYCPTKRTTEDVFHTLRKSNFSVDFYHAARNLQTRDEVHEKFLKDELEVIVATVAFGMGIDKPDVRNVIHWGAPKDIESYYQEIGRAGRDGLPARCQVFYSSKDFAVSKYFQSKLGGAFADHRKEMGKLMECYLDSTACRRQCLLMHFEGKTFQGSNEPKELCCDNCSTAISRRRLKNSSGVACTNSGLHDFTDDTELFLKTTQALRCKGLTKIIACIRGSKTSTIYSHSLNLELHGKGKHKSAEWWKALSRLILREGYVEQQYLGFGDERKGQKFPVPVIVIAMRGLTLLSNLSRNRTETFVKLPVGQEISKLIAIAEKRKEAAKNPSGSQSSDQHDPDKKTIILPGITSDENKNQALYRHLVRVRKGRADELDCAPFHVASNQALIDLSSVRPSSLVSLKEGHVDGFTDLKIERDGQFWITYIVDFCKENEMETDLQNSSNENEASENLLLGAARDVYTKFQKDKMSLEQLCSERKNVQSTVVTYLCEALTLGLPLDLPRAGLPDSIQDIVRQVISSPPINSNVTYLKPIKTNCPDFVTYDQIKLTVSYLKGRYLPQQESTNSNADVWSQHDRSDTNQSSITSQLKGFVTSSKQLQSQKKLSSIWHNDTKIGGASCSKKNSSFWQNQYSSAENNDLELSPVRGPDSAEKSTEISDGFKQEIREDLEERNILSTDVRTESAPVQFSDDLEVSMIMDVNWNEDMFHDSVKDEPGDVENKTEEPSHQRNSEDGNTSMQKLVSEDSSFEIFTASPPRPKRRVPDWLSQGQSKTKKVEVCKKLKNNSLFKM